MTRTRLPSRHASTNLTIEVGNLKFVCTFSRFADGRLGEVFLSDHRVNSQVGIWASDQAVLASLALQFGCPLETMSRAVMRDSAGRAMSPIGAALDLIAKEDE